MRRALTPTVLLSLLLLCASATTLAQQVIDRIVARIEDDVILLSEVQELSRYQKFVNGQSESDQQILDRLIDQWIVRTEAQTSRFPQPSPADVQRNVEQIKKSFASPEEYETRKKESGLTDNQLRAMSAAQLYLTNYLDSRFRPSIQVDSKAIEDYYQIGVLARAKAGGQQPPTLEASRDYIQEFLVLQGINEEADRWLKESRSHLHVDNLLNASPK
jgi:parvulin-like peptidyl-prolyl isomerase